MKKIIIIGSRRRDTEDDYKAVYNVFRKVYNDGDILVSGGCPKGGDRFCEVIAKRMGCTEENGKLIIHRPNKPPKGSPRYKWAEEYYKRNTLVAQETEENSVVIACVAPDRTGGTEDTLKKVERHNKINLNNIFLV